MTAYEMRISDWSSDVCSSDLPNLVIGKRARRRRRLGTHLQCGFADINTHGVRHGTLRSRLDTVRAPRSEEHTSELQSLMRISYAVFCLKKKKIIHYSTILLYI